LRERKGGPQTKASYQSVLVFAKVYCGFLEEGAGDLVGELVDFHANHVDPREVYISNVYLFAIVNDECGKTTGKEGLVRS
jgi:hypothetical protein